MYSREDLRDLIPEFIQRHWPEEDSDQVIAMTAISMFISELPAKSPIQAEYEQWM